MGRRRGADGDAASMDSLMDTLTNVVGIQIIMLASLQLDVTSTVQRIQGVDPLATAEAVQALETKSAEQEARRQKLEENAALASPALVDSQIKQMSEDISKLRLQLAEPTATTDDPEKLKEEVEQLKQSAAQMESALENKEKEIAQKRSQLAEVKPAGGPPAKLIGLPNPRAVPPEFTPVYVLCQHDRVAVIDFNAAIKSVVDALQRAMKGDKTCDCGQAADIINKADQRKDVFQFEFREINKMPHVVIKIGEGKGTATRLLNRPNSTYRRDLEQIDPTKQYVRFLVWPDSYEVYTAARKECDERNIAAGWQPMKEKEEWIHNLLGSFQCVGYVPPPPGPPPPPPDPNKPAPPPDTVD